jgi:nicotinate phosphoribosyltransferase
MTVWDHARLPVSRLKLDVNGLQRGDYSDKYFENVVHVLEGAAAAGYRFEGQSPRLRPDESAGLPVGDIEVEAQIFTRRSPFALVGGVDVALAMLRVAGGANLEAEAVEDGSRVRYEGDTENVQPVMKIRGRYRDFALLETPILGVLTRITRMATNSLLALQAAAGKGLLFFPARFDVPDVQPADGYAYWLAVQSYNHESGTRLAPLVSTDAQARWWDGRGSGTVPHALIACFLADTAEAMRAFALYSPVDILRVALLDFENDAVGAALATLAVYWPRYLDAKRAGDVEGQMRWRLFGVRLDTSSNMRDVSLGDGDAGGVTPALVLTVRAAIDRAWEQWDIPDGWLSEARDYCRQIKIVVSGGFHAGKIALFEREGVPSDLYGVGSTLLRNAEDVGTDFTMDVVRVKVHDQWVDMAKKGRKPNDNPELKPVRLSDLPL